MESNPEAIEQLEEAIAKIDAIKASNTATEYLLSNIPTLALMDHLSGRVQFWGVTRRGHQRFVPLGQAAQVATFPSMRLAERVREFSGGYVITVIHFLTIQRKLYEGQLRLLKDIAKNQKIK